MGQLTAYWSIIIVQLVTVDVEEQTILQKYVAVCIIIIMRTFSVSVIDKVGNIAVDWRNFICTYV